MKMRTLIPAIMLAITATSGASAVAAPVLATQRAVEADRVTVTLHGNGRSGAVRVEGCDGCPLELTIDPATTFSHIGKTISPIQARIRSGQAGSVTYDSSTLRASRINW